MMLLGDEAIAMGAVHAGISASYAYPGTPATEIQETVQKYIKANPACGIRADWSINEKVAYEEAIGASMIGLRSLVSFKHVGLNVAADPFMSSMITGVGGGLVLAPCDDPGMHSSQNEQDSRFYAFFARIPCLEPADSQEAYEMTREAFDLSERFGLPAMVRSVTRLSHTRSAVGFSDPLPKKKINIPKDFKRWTVLPGNAREGYIKLLAKQTELTSWSNSNRYNEFHIKRGVPVGVIASGLGYNYFMEAVGDKEFSFLRIATYPLPEEKIRELIKNVSSLVIVEEGYPLIERLIWRYIAESGKKMEVRGKLTGDIPEAGELNADVVRNAFGLKNFEHVRRVPAGLILPRPPQLCKGCSHADTYKALNSALEGKTERLVFSDIGCYTLGFYPPYEAIHSCICMGASVSMAKAAAENGLKYSVAVIGESTFDHSGMTPLLEGIKRNTPFTTVILDNSTTAMTGGQETICIGEELERVIIGMGIAKNHLRVIKPVPARHEENVKIIREELEYGGPSVIIARRECLRIRK